MGLRLSRRELLVGATAFVPMLYVRTTERRTGGSPGNAQEALAAIEKRLNGRLGVAAWDTGSGKRIEHRAGERFPMCSTFKFVAVAAVLSRVDKNEEKLDRVVHYTNHDLLEYAPITEQHVQEGMTVSALCAAAVQYSDNTAANLLLTVLGGPEGVTRYARLLGDTVTRLDRNEPMLNTAITGDVRDTTSPSAMLGDMKKLLIDRGALSEESQKRLQEWIIGNTTGGAMLRAGLPSTWRIGDKTGHGRNGSTNDIAIGWPTKRKPILITAYFVESAAPAADCYAAIAEVGRIVAAEFG
jgi:beta-lactamase class A